jgi:hypothetical protein
VKHLASDIQFFVVLACGGSAATFAVTRVRYGKDWFDPWLTVTKALCILALITIAIAHFLR